LKDDAGMDIFPSIYTIVMFLRSVNVNSYH